MVVFLGAMLILLLGLTHTPSLHSQPYAGVLLQAVKDAVRNLPAGHEALQREGFPLVIFYDLDGDGMEDLFLLSTKKTDGMGVTDLKILSDYSRVFEAKAAQPFFLHIFLRRQTFSSMVKTIDLGIEAGVRYLSQLRNPAWGSTSLWAGVNLPQPGGPGKGLGAGFFLFPDRIVRVSRTA
jgi:hypothetical protein